MAPCLEACRGGVVVCPTRLEGFRFFQWSAQRARGGFVFEYWFAQRFWAGFGFYFQWSAQRVCGLGVGFFKYWSAQRARGDSFLWSAQRGGDSFLSTTVLGGFRIFFFNGLPNGSAG